MPGQYTVGTEDASYLFSIVLEVSEDQGRWTAQNHSGTQFTLIAGADSEEELRSEVEMILDGVLDHIIEEKPPHVSIEEYAARFGIEARSVDSILRAEWTGHLAQYDSLSLQVPRVVAAGAAH